MEFEVTIQRRNLFNRVQRAKELEALTIPTRGSLKLSVSMTLGRSESDQVGYVRSLVVKMGEDDLSVTFDAKGEVKSVMVMGRQEVLDDSNSWWVLNGQVVPSPVLLVKDTISDDDGTDWYWEPHPTPFRTKIIDALAALAHGNTSRERLQLIASKLAYGEATQFQTQLISDSDTPDSLRYRIRQLGPDGLRELRRAVLLSKLTPVLSLIDGEIERFARGVKYLEPLRASAERYYREQDLAVDEIDSRGTNTAMFLSSLEDEELEALQAWMTEHFGFSVSVESSTGHVQVSISDAVHGRRNIADLGFGYSQVLPIVLQLWRATKARGEEQVTVAIEQPELHLHPHFQSVLADVMGAVAAQRSSRPSRVFVETHSDHFVNRLGMLVALGKISADDIQVIVVSEDAFGDSKGQVASFGPDGTLDENWPPGFFTPVF